jgi:F-type H+-transporting ATPase subunit b
MTIDWATLGLQTVNVLVLIWLLRRFFWRPLAGMIEQRRAAAQAMLTEAAAKRAEAEAAVAAATTTRAGFAQEREAILAQARTEAEQLKEASLADTAREVATLEAGARAAIERDQAAVDHAWRERANLLAVDIASRLAARLAGSAVQAAFLDFLCAEIGRLPEAVRGTAAKSTLELTSAVPLDAAEQERCAAAIGAAFGAHPQLRFKTDPALIAGLELHGPELALSNSWRADLARILAELAHE